MDELLSLFDCDDNTNIVPHEEEETYNDRDQSSLTTFFADAASSLFQQSSSVRNHSSQQQQQQQQQNDPLTGLRIVDRRTSHATLLDIYSNFIYAPCSIVAAASRNEWNTNYLISSANNEGGGKTQLATCGILTSDVYSQISPKSGKAFAILSLGSLTPSSLSSSSTIGIGGDNTVRPSITVFLFGNALSVLHADTIKYMKVGYVISVLGPNLLPPRQQQQQQQQGGGCSSSSGSSTSVTLSVSDAKQILHIGKAADCDRCKGMARKRVVSMGTNNMNNRWEEARCSTLVDTRQFGGYCTAHRRQGLLSSSSSSSGSTTKAGGSTFMQRHRQESASSRTTTTTTVAPPRVSGTKRPSPLSEALSKSGLLGPIIPTPTASIMMDTAKPLRHLSRAPMHMKKKMGNEESKRPVVMTTTTFTSAVVPTANPYMRKRMIDRSLSTCGREDDTMREQKKQCDNEDILGNALEQWTKKRSRATQRKDDKQVHRPMTKVFTVEGYDGSVPVPKPNTILFRPRSNEHAMRNNTVTPSPTSLSSSVILERQKNLAELLKRHTPIANDNKKLISQRLNKSTNASSVKGTSGEFASIFGQNDNGIQQQSSSLNDIANARSRFASAVDAQEYTRARAIVQALELREESSNNGMKKDSSQVKGAPRVAIVTAGWTCRTCQKVTPYKPSACVRINHDVQQRRELKDERGTKKSATTGLSSRKDQLINEGLILGSGLEWSGWRGGF
jgi:hypothetical protein